MTSNVIRRVLKTVFEADAFISQLASHSAWNGVEIGAVLSQDSDFFVFDVPYLCLKGLRIVNEKISGSLIPRGQFSTILYSLGVKRLQLSVMKKLDETVKRLIENLCTLEKFQLLLSDVATLGTNDFYRNNTRNDWVPATIYLADPACAVRSSLEAAFVSEAAFVPNYDIIRYLILLLHILLF